MNPALPLAGLRVLVTRPAGRGAALRSALAALGARVELRPTLAFEPLRDPGPAAAAVEGIERYHLVAFTSATGVRFFDEALRRARRSVPGTTRIAAIGRATAEAVRAAGLDVHVVPGDERSEGLAAALAAGGIAGSRVLLVRPEVARAVLVRELGAAGAEVDAVAFYRTVPHPGAGETAARMAGGSYDVAVFTSPSTFEMLLSAAGEDRGRCRRGLAATRRIAIGPVTAQALADAGLAADRVAETPDDAAVIEAVRGLAGG